MTDVEDSDEHTDTATDTSGGDETDEELEEYLREMRNRASLPVQTDQELMDELQTELAAMSIDDPGRAEIESLIRMCQRGINEERNLQRFSDAIRQINENGIDPTKQEAFADFAVAVFTGRSPPEHTNVDFALPRHENQ